MKGTPIIHGVIERPRRPRGQRRVRIYVRDESDGAWYLFKDRAGRKQAFAPF